MLKAVLPTTGEKDVRRMPKKPWPLLTSSFYIDYTEGAELVDGLLVCLIFVTSIAVHTWTHRIQYENNPRSARPYRGFNSFTP